jgi:hypothetical protein
MNPLTPEEWLNKHIRNDDWNMLEEQIQDSLWTNNVLEYMKKYAEYLINWKENSNEKN